MLRRVTLLAAAVAVAMPSGHANASSTIDAPGGALRGASRLENARQTKPPAPTLTAELQRVLDLTNAERVNRGIAPLTYDLQLGQAADGHSRDQAAMRNLTHTGSDGSNPGQRIDRTGYDWRTWAENAAAGYRSADAVMEGWMGSAGHRANILNPNVTQIGLGLATTSDGYPYWTQVFAAPR